MSTHQTARSARVSAGARISAARAPHRTAPGGRREAHRRRLLGSYPGPDSPASCYLVEADQDGRTWRVLLDLGSGALGRLHRHADPLSIDGVFISHLHPDHWFDMSGYYVLRSTTRPAGSHGSPCTRRRAPRRRWPAPTACPRTPA